MAIKKHFLFSLLLSIIFAFQPMVLLAAQTTARQASVNPRASMPPLQPNVIGYSYPTHVILHKYEYPSYNLVARNVLNGTIALMPESDRNALLAGDYTFIEAPFRAMMTAHFSILHHFAAQGNTTPLIIRYAPFNFAQADISTEEQIKIAAFVEKIIDTLTMTSTAHAQVFDPFSFDPPPEYTTDPAFSTFQEIIDVNSVITQGSGSFTLPIGDESLLEFNYDYISINDEGPFVGSAFLSTPIAGDWLSIDAGYISDGENNETAVSLTLDLGRLFSSK